MDWRARLEQDGSFDLWEENSNIKSGSSKWEDKGCYCCWILRLR